MPEPERFSYSAVRTRGGTAALRPLLPLTLFHEGRTVDAIGLLDSGADVSVMPYELGVQLGAVWETSLPVVHLSGNLAQVEARAIIVDARVGHLPVARLAFAWTRSDEVPLLLGQVNFFAELDVCFFRSEGEFEIREKRSR
jgi:hypothetical protein